MTIYKEYKIGTASTGTWSDNTGRFHGDALLHVVVQAATGTTTFDFSLVNDDSVTVKTWNRNTGELNEEVYIPLRGIYTMQISNASADEEFKILLMVDES